MNITKTEREAIAALPDEIKRQIVESYAGPLAQLIYHRPSGQLISVWAMALEKPHDYITTSMINEATNYAFADPRRFRFPPAK